MCIQDVYVNAHVPWLMSRERSEDNFWKSVLSFSHVGPGVEFWLLSLQTNTLKCWAFLSAQNVTNFPFTKTIFWLLYHFKTLHHLHLPTEGQSRVVLIIFCCCTGTCLPTHCCVYVGMCLNVCEWVCVSVCVNVFVFECMKVLICKCVHRGQRTISNTILYIIHILYSLTGPLIWLGSYQVG